MYISILFEKTYGKFLSLLMCVQCTVISVLYAIEQTRVTDCIQSWAEARLSLCDGAELDVCVKVCGRKVSVIDMQIFVFILMLLIFFLPRKITVMNY